MVLQVSLTAVGYLGLSRKEFKMSKEFEDSNKMVTEQGSIVRYAEESHGSRLARKSKEAPLFPIGIAGLTLACLYGAYKFRHRGTMSTSVFLMQLRVAAQGTVVACLTVGVGYSLYRDYFKKSTFYRDYIKKSDESK